MTSGAAELGQDRVHVGYLADGRFDPEVLQAGAARHEVDPALLERLQLGADRRVGRDQPDSGVVEDDGLEVRQRDRLLQEGREDLASELAVAVAHLVVVADDDRVHRDIVRRAGRECQPGSESLPEHGGTKKTHAREFPRSARQPTFPVR